MERETQFGITPENLPSCGAAQTFFPVSDACNDANVNANLAERLLVICVLVFSTGGFVNLFPGEKGLEGREQGLLFAQVLWSLLYILMLWLIRNQLAEIGRRMWNERFLLLLLGWAFLSVLWSIDRQVTLRHFVALVGSCIFGVYFAVRYGIGEQLRFLLIALGIVTVASVLACIFFPTYGITVVDDPFEPPGWHGVFSTKNNLGTIALLEGVILAFFFAKHVRRTATLIGLASVFGLIVLTQSMTALVYFVVGTAFLPFLIAWQRNSGRRTKIVYSTVTVLSGGAAWIYYNWDSFLGYLGKDPGMTGRFMLWDLALSWIRERPIFGFGYDAFWSDYYGPAADFRLASGWLTATHAHNGFLNLWLDLGCIGLILFIVGFVIAYRRALLFARTGRRVEGLWPVVVLTFLFLYSLTEIGFMGRNDLYWILYVSVVTGLARIRDTSWDRLVSNKIRDFA